MGDRMWCPESSMKQEMKNSEYDNCVLAHSSFLFPFLMSQFHFQTLGS